VANLLNADAFLSAQDGALDGIGKGITRMMELKTLSQDPTKNATDIQNYSTEFDEIREHLVILSKSKLNGVDLFSQTGVDTHLQATADENGQQTVTLTQYALDVNLTARLQTAKTFSRVQGSFTWQQARADAESRGGHLATITSKEEWDRVKADLGQDFNLSAWLGASNTSGNGAPNTGAWEWITGEPFSFTSWRSGEPNGSMGGLNQFTDFYLIHIGSEWDDVHISNPFPTGYVLEKSGTKLTDITTDSLNATLQYIANCRANNGAESMAVEMSVERLRCKSANLEAANGRIADVDVADETHHLNKARILVEASSAMIKQARSANEVVLRLLNL
jgi:flagellin-like hook-associated protein FlgL